jgi:hypothetical protein
MSDSDMRHHYPDPVLLPSDFRPVRPVFAAPWGARAWGLLGIAVALAGCAAGEPATVPTRDTELRAAWGAYAAFCGLCTNASTCCLREDDFTPARYSAASGPYLRALREHYECRRGDVLIDATVYTDPMLRYPEERVYARLESRTKLSCERSACAGSAEIMASELDRALASPVPHSPGALVACPLARRAL